MLILHLLLFVISQGCEPINNLTEKHI
jgi:hypothetical protein